MLESAQRELMEPKKKAKDEPTPRGRIYFDSIKSKVGRAEKSNWAFDVQHSYDGFFPTEKAHLEESMHNLRGISFRYNLNYSYSQVIIVLHIDD